MRITEDKDYASKGVAGTGLGLGIAGTALSVLNTLAGGTALATGGIPAGIGRAGTAISSDDEYVNRYEAAQNARIAELETEVKLRDANTYTDQKMLDMYTYVDGRLRTIESQICQQNVYNATNTAAIGCINEQIAQLQSLTKMVIPTSSVCPEPMLKYNSWTAPTSSSTT